MKIAFFDSHRYDRIAFEEANRAFGHNISYFDLRLSEETAKLATGFEAVCAFVNDRLDAPTLKLLAEQGVRLVALRSAGYNHVDLNAASELKIRVCRVPSYSPHAVAEHAVALLLSLNRKICRAHARISDLNFALDGLVGFDLKGKTVGVIGTGQIGSAFVRIMIGFGCRVLTHDLQINRTLESAGAVSTSLQDLLKQSDIISLHVPLDPTTRHLIDAATIKQMRSGVVLINTSRGALIDTLALIDALKQGKVSAAGLDVYEEEENVFFHDLSEGVLKDDVLARLMTFPNVLITSHQAFLTREALSAIAHTTLNAVTDFGCGRRMEHELT